MSRRIFAHLAALRHQIRRIEQATIVGTVALVPCAAILMMTSGMHWSSLVLLLVLVGYLRRKVGQIVRARQAVKQLRLEEQFVRHCPAPKHVLTCTRRPNHLWTRSLTLKGSQALLAHPPAPRLPLEDQRRYVRHHYIRAFTPLWPPSTPVDLLWFAALGLFWFWFVPEALLQAPSLGVLACAGLLLVILVAEIIQVVLQADLRGGFEHLATLLSDWTLAQPLELHTIREKTYRHTALYRANTPALTAHLS
ncbi:MAG: hypothetical protein IH820_03890 [Bacteroidetes bacterium]|nr:hypothetical protein [Bacteroidota bacterium]